jgi:hypothetical protein
MFASSFLACVALPFKGLFGNIAIPFNPYVLEGIVVENKFIFHTNPYG